MSRLARFQSAALFVSLLYLTFLGGTFYTDFNFPLRLFHQALVTLLLGGWLAGLLWRGAPLPRTDLDWPIAACLVAGGLAACLGVSARYSWEQGWNVAALTLGFYLLVSLMRRGMAGPLARALYLAAAAVCVVALVEWFSWYFGLPLVPMFAQGWPQAAGWAHLWPPYIYRVGLPLNGPTPLSAYLALLIPPAVALRLTVRDRDDRQALSAWLALAGVVEILSFSRGGLLALAVSLPAVGAAWLALSVTRDKLRAWWARPPVRGALIAGGLVALAALVLAVAWYRQTYGSRAGSTEFRYVLWQAAVDLFADRPITGAGPYNFGRGLLLRNDPALPRFQNTAAHNLYLNMAAETGLLGLLAGGWLLASAGRAWRRRWRAASAPEARLLLAGAGAALLGFAVQSLVDTFLAWPVLLPVLALAAYGLADASPPAQSRRWIPALALGALAVYGLALAGWARADAHFEASVRAAQRRQIPAAIEEAQQAYQQDPRWPLYVFQLAYLEAQAGQLAESAAHYREGLGLEPVDGIHTANLAAVLWQLGERDEARAMLARAARAASEPVYLVNLGYFFESDGYESDACAWYAEALARAPELAASEFWQAEAGRAAFWPEVMRQAEALVLPASAYSRSAWRLKVALARQDWPGVEIEAHSVLGLAPADYAALAAMTRAAVQAGQHAEADRWAEAALTASGGTGGQAYWVRGQVYQAQGLPAQAERNWRIALFLGERRAEYDLGQLALARGDEAAAQAAWRRAFLPHSVSQNMEVTLYNRRATFDILPPLFRLGVGQERAAAWLALGEWLTDQRRLEEARQIYQALLDEDPYLSAARRRLSSLPPDPGE